MNFLHTVLGLFIQTVHAGNPIQRYCETLHTGCSADRSLIIELANGAIRVVSRFIGGLAVLAILWGALRIVTDGGRDEGKNQGQSIILAACVGLVLALLGEALVFFVQSFVENHAAIA